MNLSYRKYINIATIWIVAMFFSCTNNTQKVRDFLVAKNLPIGVAKDIYHVYKDSGRITSKLITPVLHDFSNRKEHPYNEFPKGLKIISFETDKDSVTITGDYGLSYNKTLVSEIVGNVVVINHTEKTKLETEQLFWDQKTGYFFSEKKFKFTTEESTFFGIGFESNGDLSKRLVKNLTGTIETKETDE